MDTWVLNPASTQYSIFESSPVIIVLITYAFGHSLKVNAKLSSEAMHVCMFV